MIRFKLFGLFVFFICLSVFFPKNAFGKKTLNLDTTSVQKIEVSDKVINQYRKDSDFQYQQIITTPNFFQRLLLKLNEWFDFQKIVSAVPWIVYSIFILAFVLLMLILFRNKIQGIFLSNRNESGITFHESEISENIDFDVLLKNACTARNYNLAIRYLYLILLRELNQKSLITYKVGKTNFEYLNEIKKDDILSQFKKATYNYEYVWYGHFFLDESSYKSIETDFRSLINRLNG